MKKRKKARSKKRIFRLSTKIMAFILLGALLFSGYSWYDLFLRRPDPPKAVKAKSIEEKEEDPESKKVQTVLPDETDIKVVNEDTAWEALEQLKWKYGIHDVEEEYELISSSETEMSRIYRFQQEYDDLEVFGHQLKLMTDLDGTVQNMNGSYANTYGMDTSVVLDDEEASDYALNYLAKKYNASKEEFSLTDAEKGIYVPTVEDAPQVCYRFGADGAGHSLQLYVSSKDGKVLLESTEAFFNESTVTLDGQLGKKELTANLNEDGTYTLYDPVHNIYIVDNEANKASEEKRKNSSSIFERDFSVTISEVFDHMDYEDKSITYVPNDYSSKAGVDALANLEIAMDYYSSQFSRLNLSGEGRPLIVEVNSNDLISEAGKANGGWMGKTDNGNSIIMFSPPENEKSADCCAYLDIVGHEYTHGIVCWSSSLGADQDHNSESAAIQEGLADVFGELIEDYGDDGNLNNGKQEWFLSSARKGEGRDIAHALSPQRGDPLITLAKEYEKNIAKGKADCHEGSAIISYPAYLMTKKIDNTTIGKLYYETIQRLNPDSGFKVFRAQIDCVLIQKNENQVLSDDQMECAIDALDMSGIEPVICKYKVENKGLLNILDKHGDPYKDYEITLQKGTMGGKTIVDKASANEGSCYRLPSSVVPGYYTVILKDKNKPHAEVSFCMLVNDNASEASGRIEPYQSTQEVETPFNGQTQEIVFVLDKSGSMRGDPLESAKAASTGCVENILTNDPTSRISVIEYSDDPSTLIQSSNNKQQVLDSITGLSSGGDTNTYAALEAAGDILKSEDKKAAKKKIIVLLSDGLPNKGPDVDGDYHKPIADLTQDLKDEGILFYTVGSFSELSNEDAVGAEDLMREVSSPGYNYNIESDEMEDVFFDISQVVNGVNYQNIRIACPVDVKITSGGETLSSAEEDLNKRTGFGYLSFEGDESDPVKIVRLKDDGRDYDICITGIGQGTMDYSISYPDENGEYTDTRIFEKIPIQKGTFITTGTDRRTATFLQVDADGDGGFELSYRASRNGSGKAAGSIWGKIAVILGIAALIIYGIVKLITILKRIEQNGICETCGYKVKPKQVYCPNCGGRHEYIRPFFPRKEPLPKQRTGLLVFKICVISLCLIAITTIYAIRKTAAVTAFHQVQDHKFSSATVIYKNGVEGKGINKAIFGMLMNPYVKQLNQTYKEGKVSEGYYQDFQDALKVMGYGGK